MADTQSPDLSFTLVTVPKRFGGRNLSYTIGIHSCFFTICFAGIPHWNRHARASEFYVALFHFKVFINLGYTKCATANSFGQSIITSCKVSPHPNSSLLFFSPSLWPWSWPYSGLFLFSGTDTDYCKIFSSFVLVWMYTIDDPYANPMVPVCATIWPIGNLVMVLQILSIPARSPFRGEALILIHELIP